MGPFFGVLMAEARILSGTLLKIPAQMTYTTRATFVRAVPHRIHGRKLASFLPNLFFFILDT